MKRFEFLTMFLPCLTFRESTVIGQGSGESIEQLSIIQLIANPEKYDEKPVLVDGFLHLEFEGDMLYLHEEDQKHLIMKNGIWVERNSLLLTKRESLNNHYVTLVGTFSAKNKGHLSLASGSLTNITHARLLQ